MLCSSPAAGALVDSSMGERFNEAEFARCKIGEVDWIETDLDHLYPKDTKLV
jgi:hypothetical protein